MNPERVRPLRPEDIDRDAHLIRFTDAAFAASMQRHLYYREHDELPHQAFLPLVEG